MSNPSDLKAIAIFALGKSILSDSNLQVRIMSIASLEKIGDERAIPFLVEALDDPDPKIRMRVAQALGKICSPMSEIPVETIKGFLEAEAE